MFFLSILFAVAAVRTAASPPPQSILPSLSAVSHYNAAVQDMDNPNKIQTIIQQLTTAKKLAFDSELRLKSTWNLASVLVEELFNTDSSINLQQEDVISAWRDVLDLPDVAADMRNQAHGTLRSLTHGTRTEKKPVPAPPGPPPSPPSPPPPPPPTLPTAPTSPPAPIAPPAPTAPTISALKNIPHTLHTLLRMLRKHDLYLLETASLEIFEKVGEMLHCMVISSDIELDGVHVDSAALPNIAPCTRGEIEWDDVLAADKRNLLRFVSRIVRSVVRPHRRRLQRNQRHSNVHALKVAVVGAGPTGLSTAIVALREGAETVTVYEKRGIPTRQHWFDSNPRTNHLLKQWGLDLVDIRMELEEEMPGYATLQCHMLERFLGLIAMASGVAIQRHVEVEHLDQNENILILRDLTDAKANIKIDSAAAATAAPRSYSSSKFDILFVADGTSSHVRTSSTIASSFQRVVTTVLGQHMVPRNKKEKVSQTTLILGFQTDVRGRCPLYDRTKTAFDPAVLDTNDRRITAIFKRLYPPFCECQILFSNTTFVDHPLEIDRAYVDTNDIPWELVRKNINHLFTIQYDTVNALRLALLPYLYNHYEVSTANVPVPKKHAVLFRMGIRKTDLSAFGHNIGGSSGSGSGSGSGGGALVVFRGDALVSAHYRLGIGINQAFESLDMEVTAPIKQFMFRRANSNIQHRKEVNVPQEAILKELAEAARRRSAPRIEWMVQVQLFTMMFESYCDVIVDNSNLNDLVVLRKDFVAKEVHSKPLGEDDIISLECMREFVPVQQTEDRRPL